MKVEKAEKLQYDINREAAKISALSSGKIDKYEYLMGKEVLPSNKKQMIKQMIEQAKFTYSPLGKAFEKQTEKQVDAKKFLKLSFDKTNELKQIKSLFPQNMVNKMVCDELKIIIDRQNSIELDKLYFKDYGFDKVSIPGIFLRDTYKNNLSIEDSDNEQSDLFKMFGNLNKG